MTHKLNYPANAFGLHGREYIVYDNSYEFDLVTLKHMIDYANMAKQFMNKPFSNPYDIVGNYEWHQNFPYVECLTRGIDLPEKAFMCDFGCGPGRMVQQFKDRAYVMDGIDVSTFALDYLRKQFDTDSRNTFYESSGIDLGDANDDTYDLVFSTIAIQHIPSRTIRNNIFRGIHNIVRPGGYMSVQMGYHPTYGAGRWSHDTEHATYMTDFWNAQGTNGHADVVINQEALPLLRKDIADIFRVTEDEVVFDFENVDQKYANLGGAYHAPYWCSDWIFIKVKKPDYETWA
jgi:SAM-dependent methyltransferase